MERRAVSRGVSFPKRDRIRRSPLGAWPTGNGTRFRIWAPKATTIEVLVERANRPWIKRALKKSAEGMFNGWVARVQPGDRYRFRIDGKDSFPDPASRFQPEGVHGSSEIVDPNAFAWTDDSWKGIGPEELVIYELHVGTFSPEGTFAGAMSRLEYLRDLGATALELMPVTEFAGERSWGYDGVDLFAPSSTYGKPDDLRRLVDRAHRLGLAILLDVVYNHFGPVGNYATAFSDKYLRNEDSAWAAYVNLDEEGCDRVQEFLIENALHWLNEYHIDGLRLDATHALRDDKPPHFLEVLSRRVRQEFPGRWIPLIAEDHRNLDTMIRPDWAGGWNLDGVWADDFHHQVRRLIAGDDEGYYRDYSGTTADIAETLNQGWYYTGQHSIHLNEPRGTDPVGIPPRKFVICLQNHDQVGNRAFGDRLHHTIDPAVYRAATALFLCAPQTPLLFMGQEWAATAPFLYFTDHDEDLGKIVTEGRRREFRHFLAFVDPKAREKIPDPQDPATFEASRLNWEEIERDPHASTLRLHQNLLSLRRTEPALLSNRIDDYRAVAIDEDALALQRGCDDETLLLVVRLRGSGKVAIERSDDIGSPTGFHWRMILSTENPRFASDSSPPRIDLSGPTPTIEFARPSAVLFKVERD